MNTKEKYDLDKRKAILLFVQMILIIIGFLAQIGILVLLCKDNLNPYMIVSSISIILSFIAAMVYAVFGYKKSGVYYLIAVGFFLFAILMNNILPFRDTTQRITLTILFGIFFAFLFTQKDYRLSHFLIIIGVLAALTFSIYSSITANVNSLGEVSNKVFAAIMMYTSIFTPVILSGLFGITCLVRNQRENNK